MMPRPLSTELQRLIFAEVKAGNFSCREFARLHGVSRSAVERAIRRGHVSETNGYPQRDNDGRSVREKAEAFLAATLKFRQAGILPPDDWRADEDYAPNQQSYPS